VLYLRYESVISEFKIILGVTHRVNDFSEYRVEVLCRSHFECNFKEFFEKGNEKIRKKRKEGRALYT